jgi:hypothetical protein
MLRWQLVAPVVFQDCLVRIDNQPDDDYNVNRGCWPFLFNHSASLILTIIRYPY